MGENGQQEKDEAKEREAETEHAPRELPFVRIDSNNLKIRSGSAFYGDRARSAALYDIFSELRKKLGDTDPLGAQMKKPKRSKLDRLLLEGESDARGLVFSAVEEFAQRLADVVRRFLKEKAWKGTERIAIGGGMRNSRVGELAIARAAMILRLEGLKIGLKPIDNDPDEAGLIGAAYLFAPERLAPYDAMLAVDIGGSNIRAGILKLPKQRSPYPTRVKVRDMTIWRHADDDPSREEAYGEMVRMLKDLIARADKEGFDLAPCIGIGCPGNIQADGTIRDGGHNLPGNWEAKRFNLPERLHADLPRIDDERAGDAAS